MKNFNIKSIFVAFAALATIACSEEGTITSTVDTMVIKSDTTFSGNVTLNGSVIVESGTLTIEKGTYITVAENGEHNFILIAQGAKIIAQGTASEPIIMTAENKKEGAWGGIHICGKAPINTGTNSSEVGGYPYGGTVSNDNSGILSYVVIEYAGYLHTTEKEANGFTFYGVGSGTQIDHCVAYKGADDGFEWFGGTVNGSYLVSVGNQDDSFDWTEGWIGSGQFMIADQINNGCDQTIEGDNSKTDYSLSPVSCPTLANMTLIGDDNGTSDVSGMLLRNGTYFKIYNTIASGKTSDLVIDGVDSDKNADAADQEPTDSSLDKGTSLFSNVYIASSFSNKAGDSATYTADDFAKANSQSTGAAYTFDMTIACAAPSLGTVNGYAFVDAAYAGAYSEANAQDWNMSSAWGKIVAAYLAE